MEKTLKWKNSTISYHCFGQGDCLLIAFHGYGQNASLFESMKGQFNSKYKVLAIDLPFHGRTEWNQAAIIELDQWYALINQLVKQESKNGRYSLLAYSIGGHYALCLLNNRPANIQSIFLIAADGISKNKIQKWSVATVLGRLLLKWFESYPFLFKASLVFFGWIGVWPRTKSRFFLASIQSLEQRQQLRKRWTSILDMETFLEITAKKIVANRIDLKMLFGKNDLLIPIKHARKLNELCPDSVLIESEKNHRAVLSQLQELFEV